MTTFNYSLVFHHCHHGYQPPLHHHHSKQVAHRYRHPGYHPPFQLFQLQQPTPNPSSHGHASASASASANANANANANVHACTAAPANCARVSPSPVETAPFLDRLASIPAPSIEDAGMASPLYACTKSNPKQALGPRRAAQKCFCACLVNLGLVDGRLRARLKSLKPLTDAQKVGTMSNLMHVTGVSPDQACKMLLRCRQLGDAKEDRLMEGWEFLEKEVGLNRDSMISMVTSYPQLLLHNADEMRKIHDYLASVVGFSPGELSSIYLKRPKIFSTNVELVHHTLGCLMAADVGPEDLVRIMMKAPSLFSPSVQTTFKSRLDFFRRIDFIGEPLAKAIVRRPSLLNFDLDSMVYAHWYLSSLMPRVDVKKILHRFGEVLLLDGITRMEPIVNELSRLGVTKRNVRRILLHRPQVLGFTSTGLVPVLQFLTELGVKKNMLAKVISKVPQLLTMSREDKLIPALKYLQSIGLTDDGDIQKMVSRNAHIFCCNIENNINPKFEFFMNMGLSSEEVVSMMVLFPSMFGQSIEGSLQPKYDYLVNVMKRSPTEIIDFPQYFGYSLEKRIKPRHEKLAARGLHISLSAMLICVEMDFCSRHLLRNPLSPPASDNTERGSGKTTLIDKASTSSTSCINVK